MGLCKPVERELKGVENESDIESRHATKAGIVFFVVTIAGIRSIHDWYSGICSQFINSRCRRHRVQELMPSAPITSHLPDSAQEDYQPSAPPQQ